jgi:cytochrome c oxidase subunit 2
MPDAHLSALVDTRAEYQHVFDIYVPIALGVFALVVALVVVAVLRYRRRPPERAARWHENNALEGAYAALLVVVIAFLLYVTFAAEHRVDTVAARQRPQLVVDVTAAKWEWHFHYPAYGIDRYSGSSGREELVVPAREAVRFRMVSEDVIHALWIPEVRFKHDLTPGAVQNVTLVFARTGRFSGACAEFCGLLHSQMTFAVRVLPSAAFATWAAAQRAAQAAPGPGSPSSASASSHAAGASR